MQIASSSSSTGKLRVPRSPAIRIRQAVRDNNISLLQRLSSKTDLRNTDRYRLTSLSWAAAEGSLEVFEWLLLDYGHDDLELSRDSDNNTILHLLASVPSSQPTSLPHSNLFPPLPPSQAPPPAEQSRRSIHMTGLYYTLFPFLLDWSNSGGKTALHIAAQSGNSPFISSLLSYGADPDLTDLQGNTPLHYAAAWGHGEVARVLIEEGGASWGIKNSEGFSAGDYAYSEEIRSGMERVWNGMKGMRRDKRRTESDGEGYGGPGISRVAETPGSIGGYGNRWRSGSASTAASWLGSSSGASGNGPAYHTPGGNAQFESPPSPHPTRPRGNSSRNQVGPPVTQYPRRPSPTKSRSSPNASGYSTPRYDPSETTRSGISRSSSQSQVPTVNHSQAPTPSMSRQGSESIRGESSQRPSPIIPGISGRSGESSQRPSPVIPGISNRPLLLAPQISITTQSDDYNTTNGKGYDYGTYAQPPSSPHRPTVSGRMPSLPAWPNRNDDGSRTPARPTAAGPPLATPASSQMVTQTSSPALGPPVVMQEGIKRSHSAQVGLGLGGRGLLGGR